MDNVLIIYALLIATLVTLSARSTVPFYDHTYINPDYVVLSAAICKASCFDKCMDIIANASRTDNQMQMDSVSQSSQTELEKQCSKLQKTFIESCTKSCEDADKSVSPAIECSSNCQKGDNGCRDGCTFLLDAIKTFGTCPTSEESNKVSEAECHMDRQCIIEGAVRKCCNEKCVVPVFHPKISPNLWPPTIMEGNDGKSFDMSWKFVETLITKSVSPVLFVLQVRFHFNKELDLSKASGWRTIFMTFENSVHLSDLQAGTWYQFRVASVSKYGTRGFKSVSPPVKLSKNPNHPSAPRNLTDGAWRLKDNGKININIQWLEPANSDIQPSEYKISWVRDHGFIQPDGQSLEALTDYVQTVPADQKSYDIEGLLPDKTYKVQVTAISKWGSITLTSPPNTIFLTTPNLPKKFERKYVIDSSMSKDICVCQEESQDSRISIGIPYFIKNSLKVDLRILNFKEPLLYRVSYAPRVCIDSEVSPVLMFNEQSISRSLSDMFKETTTTTGLANVTLGPLHFSCQYTVHIQPLRIRPSYHRRKKRDMNAEEDSDALQSCFCTPSCLTFLSQRQYQKFTSSNLRCLNKAPIPLEPPVEIYFQRSQKNPESFLVFWQPPSSMTKMLEASIRYRVMWGPSIDEYLDQESTSAAETQLLMPRLDIGQAETKVLKENVSSIWLENLRRNTFYIVEVQALLHRQGVEQTSPKKSIVLSTHIDPAFQKLSSHSTPLNNGRIVRPPISLLTLSIIIWRQSR